MWGEQPATTGTMEVEGGRAWGIRTGTGKAGAGQGGQAPTLKKTLASAIAGPMNLQAQVQCVGCFGLPNLHHWKGQGLQRLQHAPSASGRPATHNRQPCRHPSRA